MKTAQLSIAGCEKNLSLNRQAPFALAIIQLLRSTESRQGLTVDEIIDRLCGIGFIQPTRNEKNSMSNLLQKLIHIGAITHPPVPGGKHRYITKSGSVYLVI